MVAEVVIPTVTSWWTQEDRMMREPDYPTRGGTRNPEFQC